MGSSQLMVGLLSMFGVNMGQSSKRFLLGTWRCLLEHRCGCVAARGASFHVVLVAGGTKSVMIIIGD